MKKRKIIYSLLVLLFLIAVILALIIFQNQQKLNVYFLDVGQGDAILVSQGSNQVLIDGGPSGQILMEKLGRYIPFWDRKIEAIIETHPDQDHIAGLASVLENYQVGVFIKSKAESDSQIAKRVNDLLQEKNIENFEAQKNTDLKLTEASLEIILADQGTKDDTNAGSVVTKLIFGENTFLLTGDLPSSKEAEIANRTDKADLKSRVLKVAHHGSKNSTTQEFLDAMDPQTAIISVGKNNRYGHPSQEIIERLRMAGVNILRTDELGDIQFSCKQKQEDCQIIAN